MTATTIALPSSSPSLFRTDSISHYPVMNLSTIFSQQFSPPPPILTQLEEIAVEPLDDSFPEPPSIEPEGPVAESEAQSKLRELKGLVREFNYRMFSMPLSVDSSEVNLATNTLNAIIDSPIQSGYSIYRPPQSVWVTLFEQFFKTMEQLPGGVEMRELALDIEIAFTNILAAIQDGEIDYVQYTVIMFASS